MSCDPGGMSCDSGGMSCDAGDVSCDSDGVSCDWFAGGGRESDGLLVPTLSIINPSEWSVCVYV